MRLPQVSSNTATVIDPVCVGFTVNTTPNFFNLLYSFIEGHKVIEGIICHLKLAFHAECPPPQVVQHELLMGAEERGDYF